MELKTTGEWSLPSGFWELDTSTPGLQLKRTALGNEVSARVARADIGALMHACVSKTDASLHYPLEFAYCPVTGEALGEGRAVRAQADWIAPFGALPLAAQDRRSAVGLRQSALPLSPALAQGRSAETQPDASMDLPPPGDYEFFSASFGSAEPALLALDPRKGTLFGWLPAARQWLELENADPLLLSESDLPRAAWRAELAADFHSRLYVSTERGLACVVPDILALAYTVSYAGVGAAVAAPIGFDGRVWAPCRTEDGGLEFVWVDAAGTEWDRIVLPGTVDLGDVGTPVAYGRMALWPCAKGQLRLSKNSSGELLPSFLPWPAGITPQFQFGTPYLSRDGSLWQICFDATRGQYVYVELGADAPQQALASSPRLCSGTYNYRFATRFHTEPWMEPEHGDDSAPSEVIIPLVELPSSQQVIGLKIESREALEALLASDGRMRAELVVDSAVSTTTFHTVAVAQPWRLRVFRHQSQLWAYHPMLKRIDGWTLQK